MPAQRAVGRQCPLADQAAAGTGRRADCLQSAAAVAAAAAQAPPSPPPLEDTFQCAYDAGPTRKLSASQGTVCWRWNTMKDRSQFQANSLHRPLNEMPVWPERNAHQDLWETTDRCGDTTRTRRVQWDKGFRQPRKMDLTPTQHPLINSDSCGDVGTSYRMNNQFGCNDGDDGNVHIAMGDKEFLSEGPTQTCPMGLGPTRLRKLAFGGERPASPSVPAWSKYCPLVPTSATVERGTRLSTTTLRFRKSAKTAMTFARMVWRKVQPTTS